MAKLSINLDDKPYLSAMLSSNKPLAVEVMNVFGELMEEACDPSKGITWAELPKKLNPSLDFGTLIKGILRGSLDLRAMSPDTFDALREEVHPLAFLVPRKDPLAPGGTRYWDWRNHYRLDPATPVNADTIAEIQRKLWFYGRYTPVDELAKALIANQVATHRGLGEPAVTSLPMHPALMYQKEHFGDLRVGKFFPDIGAFDCGKLPPAASHLHECPACKREDLKELGNYAVCMSCNAGFIVKEG